LYSNDQPFSYQPHRMGGYGQMQPMYQPYQAQQQPQPQQEVQLYCRPVASEEEARGIPVDFSGKPMVFPHMQAGRIYVKVLILAADRQHSTDSASIHRKRNRGRNSQPLRLRP